MLFGKVLRSTVPHARIKRIDASRALAMPGVRAVIASADVPAARYGNAIKDQTVFATDIVRFIGHPFAAVAADTLEIAEHALAAIEVEFEPLPPLFDPEAALAPGAPLLHPDWNDYKALPVIERDGNVAGRSRMRHGDVDAAFAEAYRVYEHRFTTALQHAGYTEPRAASPRWDGTGVVTVWSNTQLPFDMQNTLAEILDLPAVEHPRRRAGHRRRVRRQTAHRRRAFRGVAGAQSGRPVKVITTSEEELTAAYPRQAAVITLKTGVTRDGRLLAREGRVIVDCGAFASSGPGAGAVALQCLAGPYRTPHLGCESLAVYTNKVRDRLVPRAGGTDGEFRRRIADGHDRRRPRHRSARVAPAQCRAAKAIKGPAGEMLRERQHRGVPRQGGRRDRLA